MRTTRLTKTDEYFEFLADIVWLEDRMQIWEDRLLRQLHHMEFYSLVPNDENRGEDGRQLRETYLDEGGSARALPLSENDPCTMLEMLIGLSYRLALETEQTRWEKTPRGWFWVLIGHLGLDFHQASGLLESEYNNKIFHNVTLLLERRYKSDGKGGLFPLKRTQKDQKRIEIWYQMSEFLLENYPKMGKV